MLERDCVLAVLAAHLAEAGAGQGRLVLLPGEAGVGKSCVLELLVRNGAGGAEVLRGWCDPLSTPRPLGPWADLALGLGPEVETELAAVDGQLSGLLRAVLAALAERPWLLVIEDLHWADKATLDLMRLVVRRISQLPVLLIASYRDDELGPRHPLRGLLGDLAGLPMVHRCSVRPLSAGAVARLAADRGFDIAELYTITGGNPFFVTEVLRGSGDGIPETVADAVVGRLSRVSVKAQDTARAVAVLGGPVAVDLLAALVPDPGTRAAARRCARTGGIRGGLPA